MNEKNGQMNPNDGQNTIRAAAVQSAGDYLSRDGSLKRAVETIEEAAGAGAKLIVYPEGFVPAHPSWYHFYPDSHTKATNLTIELFNNSVEIPSPEVDQLAAAAAAARSYVVIGLCERVARTDGTLYNTQLYLGPDGSIIGKHRKLMPTMGERLVHTSGHGDTFGVFQTDYGPASALICGENGNPLAIFALASGHTRMHAMSWPPHFNQNVSNMPELVKLRSRAFASMARCYVISACGIVDTTMLHKMGLDSEIDKLARPGATGGSVIVGPGGEILAEAVDDATEQIIYADLDLNATMRYKLHQDIAGNYNRPDIFQLFVDRSRRELYHEVTDNYENIPEH